MTGPAGDVMKMDTAPTGGYADTIRNAATALVDGWTAGKAAMDAAAVFGGDPLSAACAQVYRPQRDQAVAAGDKVPPLYQGAAETLTAAVEVYRIANKNAAMAFGG